VFIDCTTNLEVGDISYGLSIDVKSVTYTISYYCTPTLNQLHTPDEGVALMVMRVKFILQAQSVL